MNRKEQRVEVVGYQRCAEEDGGDVEDGRGEGDRQDEGKEGRLCKN
jgi:hypothetical protein